MSGHLLTLDSLHHLLLVAEHGTFTEAARRAHLSQPALSASIQRLEESLGSRLFTRGRRGAELTPAGAALLPHASAALAAAADGERAVREIEGLTGGTVRIGAGATVCTYLLPAELARFRAAHPGVSFLLRETVTDEVDAALRDGHLDLAVVSRTSDTDEPVVGEHWQDDRLVLVGAPGLDPARAPYLVFWQGSNSRTIFDREFEGAEIAMELGSIAAIKASCRAGIGLALLSERAVTDDVKRGRLVRVEHPRTPLRREFRIVHRGESRLPPAARALREQLLRG